MHILHVTHRAWPVLGGAARHVHEIASRQVQDGKRVTVIASDAVELSALWDRRGGRSGPAAPSEADGVRYRRLAMRHLPLGSFSFPPVRRLTWLLSSINPAAAMSLARFFPWLPDLKRALDEEAADLLFAWNITLEGLTAAVAAHARDRGVPWVAAPLLHLGRPRFYTMPHQMGLLRSATAVLAQTTTDRRFMIGRGIAPDRVHAIGPGVDLDLARRANGARFRAAHGLDGPIVLALGSPSYEKGTSHLVRAMRRLGREHTGATMVLVGPGTAGFDRASTIAPGASGVTIRGLGALSEAEKWDALDAADVVAMPSRTESFGLVYLEAWACGKPVVGAREGAVPDVINDGVDGLLVPFGDVSQLSGAIRALLAEPERARAMGQRGHDKVEREYQWHQQYGRLRALVERIAGP